MRGWEERRLSGFLLSPDSPLQHHGLVTAFSLHDSSSGWEGPAVRLRPSLCSGDTVSSHHPFKPRDGHGFLLSSVSWSHASLCGSLDCARTSTKSPFVQSLPGNYVSGHSLATTTLTDGPYDGACIKETSRCSPCSPLWFTANLLTVSPTHSGCPCRHHILALCSRRDLPLLRAERSLTDRRPSGSLACSTNT